jgi:type IV pilus assembly protein PilZ
MFAKSDSIYKRRQQQCPECRKIISAEYIEQNPFPEFPCPHCGTLIDTATLENIESASQDERKEDRLNVSLQVSYNSYTEFITEYTKNVSRGGIFINTKRHYEVGETVELALFVPEMERPVKIKGEVAHVKTHNIPDEDSGIGVNFVDIDPESRTALVDFIKSRSFLM